MGEEKRRGEESYFSLQQSQGRPNVETTKALTYGLINKKTTYEARWHVHQAHLQNEV